MVHHIFLIDCAGACISAVFLGVVLRCNEAMFGVPAQMSVPLAALAGALALYSLWCACFSGPRARRFLCALVGLNSAYAVLSAGLVAYYAAQLTWWGVGYFAVEVAVLLGVILFEWRAAQMPGAAAEPRD